MDKNRNGDENQNCRKNSNRNIVKKYIRVDFTVTLEKIQSGFNFERIMTLFDELYIIHEKSNTN